MKKILLILFFGYTVSVLARTEPIPYYFSDELKNAISNCTPYSEDIYKKNPDMREQAESFAKVLFDKIDLSESRMILSVQGPKEDKCQIIIKSDYEFPVALEQECFLSHDMQKRLLDAMNDKSTETKTRKITNNGFYMTMTAREFDLTFSEIQNNFCKEIEHSSAEEEQKMKELQHKMTSFSDKFKNSLKNCSPDKDTFSMFGIKVSEIEIKGNDQGKCHIVSQGFHILLNDDELSLSSFDELYNLLTDETRVVYHPSYKYKGVLFALNECEQKKSFDYGNDTITLGKDKIKILHGVSSSYKNNVCQVRVSLIITKNNKKEDYSLLCDIQENDISSYTKPYSKLIEQFAPKTIKKDNTTIYQAGTQNDYVSAADREIFVKMYKAGICKKLNKKDDVSMVP